MLNPEITYALVGIRQRQVTALRVRERCGVEVETHVSLLCPLHPSLEVLRSNLVAVNKLSAKLTVDLVEVEAIGSGQQ